MPGYTLEPFVQGFEQTQIGPVPRVTATLSRRDILGTMGARTGCARKNYKVVPGLYCTGKPSATSPVLVTANYKLSFDALRKEIAGISAWLLVVDTRGINVWCAAGKGTFSTEEVAYQINNCGLQQIVSHREVILPQLSANGVAAHRLKKLCGFSGRFGPVQASQIGRFLKNRNEEENLRTITFSLKERAVLVPVELGNLWKPLSACLLFFIAISGITPDGYSVSTAVTRGLAHTSATLAAIVSGAILTPLLLPWLIFRQFWLKGALLGVVTAAVFLFFSGQQFTFVEQLALCLWISSTASFLGMNFTGSTPFTSLSGVEKEMRAGLPFQIVTALLSLIGWLAAPFV